MTPLLKAHLMSYDHELFFKLSTSMLNVLTLNINSFIYCINGVIAWLMIADMLVCAHAELFSTGVYSYTM